MAALQWWREMQAAHKVAGQVRQGVRGCVAAQVAQRDASHSEQAPPPLPLQPPPPALASSSALQATQRVPWHAGHVLMERGLQFQQKYSQSLQASQLRAALQSHAAQTLALQRAHWRVGLSALP